jgi:Tfp pilus assembly protein FimT
MLHPTKVQSRGFGVLEILIGLGVLLVVLAFASPSLSQATAKAELKAAVENMDLSVRMARSTARQLETDVIMHLETNPLDKPCSVTFSIPQENARTGSNSVLQDYQFPPGVRLESNVRSVRFDKRGMVESTTLLMLVSNQNEDLNERLVIE